MELETARNRSASPSLTFSATQDLARYESLLNVAMEKALERVAARNAGVDVPDFDIRGELYHLALQLAPNARQQDVNLMLEWLLPEEGERGVDIAAGTGFLTRHVVKYTKNTLYAVDPSEQQLGQAQLLSKDIIPVCMSPDDDAISRVIQPHSVDVVTSFGGIHHVPDQAALFKNVAKMLRPGGRFIAADVCAETALSHHFDTVVASKCITGHSATWLSENRIADLASNASLQLIRSERVNLRWEFQSEAQMALFFKGLHAYNIGNNEIVEDLKSALGVYHSNSLVWVNWPMLVFDVRSVS